jgi:prepilin-type processing-associated H-X9-DG protein
VRGLDLNDKPYIGVGCQFGNARGASLLFADGSVRSASSTIDPMVFESMATIHGNEIVDLSTADFNSY